MARSVASSPLASSAARVTVSTRRKSGPSALKVGCCAVASSTMAEAPAGSASRAGGSGEKKREREGCAPRPAARFGCVRCAQRAAARAIDSLDHNRAAGWEPRAVLSVERVAFRFRDEPSQAHTAVPLRAPALKAYAPRPWCILGSVPAC